MIERPTLIIMAKAPRLGHGKSRLARDIGRVEAWRVNRRLNAHTLRAAADLRWRSVLCVAPDQALALDLPGVWPRAQPRIAQGRGDLGARMARALRRHRLVAMIGTDCPGLSRRHIAAAFEALRRKPFALGPTSDGGFWIIAARRGAEAARAMSGVRWSTRHAARDVIANLGRERVALVAALQDVDSAADLAAFSAKR
ncbi:MAG: TIGR04282 family arsenosugar biosynthesis glycosyltransferase [Hyphomonadaceae bacterium]|nr:TIGR04282 family arsenosugar biosynthesis glycosyltransferase [Hyphomonadaceae bacterium]